MAIAVRAVGTIAAGTGAITPGLPAGTVKGDLLVMVCESKSGEAVTAAGWTEAPNSPQEDTTDSTRITILWRRAQGSDARTTNDPGNHVIGRIIGFSGVIGYGSPWNVTNGGSESTSDTSGSIPGAVTTVDGCMIIAACCDGIDTGGDDTAGFSSWANANLASITERIDNRRTAGDGGSIGAATGIKTTAGDYGATTVTYANTARKGLWSGALLPATALQYVTDNFNDNSLDTQIWAEWNAGDLAESSGQRRITSTTAAGYKGGDTTGIFDLTGSYVLAEFVHMLTGLTDDGTFLQLALDASNTITFYVYNDTLIAEKQVATAYTTIASAAYNSTNHRWLKIREASGTIYFDISADGVTFSNFASVANPFAITGLWASIFIGTDSANAGTDTAIIDNFNCPKVTTGRTATGLARITKVTAQTVTGKASISADTTTPQTVTGLARITKTTAQTILGLARITVSTLRTITGLARITVSTPRTVTGVARVTATTPRTVTGLARVTVSTSRTITGLARITVSTLATITGLARITKTTAQIITGLARITAVTSRTITGLARITATASQTITGKSRIEVSTPRTVTGVARVEKTVGQTTTGVARITRTTPQTILGLARITRVVAQTISGISRITVSTLQTITGKARVQVSSSQTVTGKSRVTAQVPQTINGLSRITSLVSSTVLGKARISVSNLQTILGLSRISVSQPQTLLGVASIAAQPSQSITGVARIKRAPWFTNLVGNWFNKNPRPWELEDLSTWNTKHTVGWYVANQINWHDLQ